MKTLFFSLILLVALILLSCNRTPPNQNVQKVESVQNPDSNKDFSKLGFELMRVESIGGLRIGLKETDLREIIDNPDERSKPLYYGADGLMHITLKYNIKGIELDLFQTPDSSYAIGRINITPPCNLKTSKGIGINSRLEDVKSAYKYYFNPQFSDDMTFVAGTIYGGIIFQIEDKKVKSIFIGAAAE
jgi:hypothetical protein